MDRQLWACGYVLKSLASRPWPECPPVAGCQALSPVFPAGPENAWIDGTPAHTLLTLPRQVPIIAHQLRCTSASRLESVLLLAARSAEREKKSRLFCILSPPRRLPFPLLTKLAWTRARRQRTIRCRDQKSRNPRRHIMSHCGIRVMGQTVHCCEANTGKLKYGYLTVHRGITQPCLPFPPFNVHPLPSELWA